MDFSSRDLETSRFHYRKYIKHDRIRSQPFWNSQEFYWVYVSLHSLVKVEKANAILKYHRLRNIMKLFHFAELFFVLILFFWIFTRLPFNIQISSEYLWKILTIIDNLLFIFLFCNAIIIILLFKSSQFSNRNLPIHNVEADIYKEFVKKSENNRPNSQSEYLYLSQEPAVVM